MSMAERAVPTTDGARAFEKVYGLDFCLKGSVIIISLKHGLKHGVFSIVWLDRSFYFFVQV